MSLTPQGAQLEVAMLQRTGCRGARAADTYAASIDRDMDSLRPVLPQTVRRILDIGCGLAGIDAALYAHYAVDCPEVHLVDVDRVDRKPVYGYHRADETGAYHSWAATLGFLTDHGVPKHRLAIYDADRGEFPGRQMDLVISLISCGFHYPVQTYLGAILMVLAPAGVCVLDIRKGTDGIERLAAGFGTVRMLADMGAYDRVACSQGDDAWRQ